MFVAASYQQQRHSTTTMFRFVVAVVALLSMTTTTASTIEPNKGIIPDPYPPSLRRLLATAASSLNSNTDRHDNYHDAHGCLFSAGYTWCPATQSCVRAWDTPCANKGILPDSFPPSHPMKQRSLETAAASSFTFSSSSDSKSKSAECDLACPSYAACVMGQADFSERMSDIKLGPTHTNSMFCACPDGWTGILCDIQYARCSAVSSASPDGARRSSNYHECYHGGTCLILDEVDRFGNAQVTCDCSTADPGYGGTYCEETGDVDNDDDNDDENVDDDDKAVHQDDENDDENNDDDDAVDIITTCGNLECHNYSKCVLEKVYHPTTLLTSTTHSCECVDDYHGTRCQHYHGDDPDLRMENEEDYDDGFDYDDDRFDYDDEFDYDDDYEGDRTDCGTDLVCYNDFERCMMTKAFHPKTGETKTKYECQYDDDDDALVPMGAILGIVLAVVLIATFSVIISLRYCGTKKKIAASATGNNVRDDVDDVLDADEASLPYWKKVID